jgi:PAS domain-containing protein
MSTPQNGALDRLARGVLDILLEGFQVIGPDWKYLYVNDTVAVQGKRSREELVGRTMMECYPGIELTPMFEVLRRCMREHTPDRMENEFTYPDCAFRSNVTACFAPS